MENCEKFKNSDDPTSAWIDFLYRFCGSYTSCLDCPLAKQPKEKSQSRVRCFAHWLCEDEEINETAANHYRNDKSNRNVW